MSEKRNLARQIQLLEGEIKELEVKRSRSQACLIESLISHEEPNETEVQFFRTFTAEIELKRETLFKLTNQLSKLV